MITLNDLPPKMRKQAEAKIAAQRDKKLKSEEFFEKGAKIGESETEGARRGKYGNTTCEFGGIRFDSKKELNRYLELRDLLYRGLITELKLQHHFTLLEAYKTPEGAPVRKMEYIADFTYVDSEGKFIIEDVKSEATRKNAVYMIKKKLMANEGYEISEV